MTKVSRRLLTTIAAGEWAEAQVQVLRDGRDRVQLAAIETLIEHAWTARLAQPGVKLFDGPMVRLDRLDVSADQLTLHLGKTNYKAFVGTNMANPQLAEQFGRDVLANPVGVSPLLISADEQLLFGLRRSTLAYYPGRVHAFAGTMEPTDPTPFHAVRRELREELGLTELLDLRLSGVVEDHQLAQWELIFYARTAKTCDQLIAGVDPDEHSQTVAIPATSHAIDDTLLNEPRLTPVARAAMLLWGRLTFGQTWFDDRYAHRD